MSEGSGAFSPEPLDKRSLGEHIAAHLQALLLDGQLRPGDTLPSQRELATRYGTSVAAVREAISILSASGVVDARPGRGTVVLPVTQQAPSINLWLGVVHDEAEARAFLDTRQVLEHYTIAQAARRATPEQRAELLAHLHAMRDVQGDPEQFIQADLALHLAVAQAAGNPVVLRLLRAIHMPLANVLRAVSTELLQGGRFPALYATHEDIIHGIIRGDAGGATRAFDHMLHQTTEGGVLERALGRHAQPEPPLGPAFLEDLHWNLTRLIGPMADVLIPEAASELGVDPGALTRSHLGRYLANLARQLPEAKQAEWQALAELLEKRYG
ncbi:FadR/GntR family transcriptional regulator [Deinococcus multiflagellatus]|uniref:FadR/GntR family transcriptional regulator n=1 Tax=Deinococcus multiflagellatus TaxID=1656887 RepID=UPI001CCD3059|nr:FadR/GntR family transcriptional regulator [Deinococcus multiflagellatus]MBZ9713183.1 FadR family transcriptional regulator [Deinococcus multiflagellatus]